MVLSNKSLKTGVLWVRFWTYLSYLSLYSHPTKNWCFWTVVLEKILESPLDCKEIKPVHPKRNKSPEYSMEGLVLKLKLQYFGHLIQRTGSLKKKLILGMTEGRRQRGLQRMSCWMASPTLWTWVRASFRSLWWTGKLDILQSMGSQSIGHNWATELMERPTWQRSRGSLPLTSRRKWNSHLNHRSWFYQQSHVLGSGHFLSWALTGDCSPGWHLFCSLLSPQTMALMQMTQVSCAQTPDSQKL